MNSEQDQAPLRTNFLENQAKEGNVSAFKRGPVLFVLILVAIGVLYGIYSGVIYFLNIEKHMAKRNIEIFFNRPEMRNGDAYVQVRVRNLNSNDVKNIVFRYKVNDPAGKSLASGLVTLPYVVPAGDEREFSGVKLGSVSGGGSRMDAELVELTPGEKVYKLTPEQQDQFAEALMAKENQAEELEKFSNEVPEFVPGLIAAGRAAQETNPLKAMDFLEKAIKLEPKNANAHFRLGMSLMAKEKSAARKELQTAASLAPDDPEIKEKLGFLDSNKTDVKGSNTSKDGSAPGADASSDPTPTLTEPIPLPEQ